MSICPLQSNRCDEEYCAWWNNKTKECLVVSCMKKYIRAITEPNLNFNAPAQVRSDIH